MRIGLSFDLKDALPHPIGEPEDALEEYDSAETVQIIEDTISAEGHRVIRLGGGQEFLNNILHEKVDCVFNIAEGRGSYRSRESQVPAVLEMLDISYSGSDPQCLAVCLDKPLTKQLVAAAGIKIPQSLTVADTKELATVNWPDFPFPAIIKPAFEGSSKGVRLTSLVEDARQVQESVINLLKIYNQPVMVEEFIDGDEVTVGMVGNTPPQVLGMMRIVPKTVNRHFVYSLEVKRDYKRLVEYECPAKLAESTLKAISDASRKSFEVLGCRDFARVDFRIDASGVPYFLEINPLPGLGTYSDLVIMALKVGWTHHGLISAVLNAALKRYPQWQKT
ncbi:MAG: ATP-grasp domain-containing protein [Dehalococcoidales bacterium]|nr:ATP-grasp domain-containing protein [Dehalococcoidales bacterium]